MFFNMSMWKINEINQIKKDYNKLELSKEQRATTRYFGEYMSDNLARKGIHLDSIVIQGLLNFAIRDWNLGHPGREFALEARGPNGFAVATEMNNIMKKRLQNLLRDQNEWKKIDAMIDEALAEFQKVGVQKD